MIDPSEFGILSRWLEGCHKPLLFSHQRPDGDALGALCGLAMATTQLGLEPLVILYEPLPQRYRLFQDFAAWLIWDEVKDNVSRDCDAAIVLDTCSQAQLEPAMPYLATGPRTLVIDHHATRDRIGVRDGDLQLFDDTASAACLIIAEWAREAGIKFDSRLAAALFTGIATDCGWFRFSNTDTRTLSMIAELVKHGVDVNGIYCSIYQQEPLAKLRLTSRLLDSMQLHADGKLAVMTLRQTDFDAAGADRTMTEDLVNEAIRLASVEAVVMFTEDEEKGVRANFRSKQHLDVAMLAARFGGGGHARAAGARLNGQWDKVVPRVVAETLEALDGCL